MADPAVAAAMLAAISALEDLRGAVECWKAEIQTVARVVSILPVAKSEDPNDGE